MARYNINALIEHVKYGDGAPAYGGDLQADLLAALDDVEELRDLVELYHEAFPKPGDFESLGAHLVSNPKMLAQFDQLVKEWRATLNGLQATAQALNIEVDV